MITMGSVTGLLKIASFFVGTLFVFFSVKAIVKETSKNGR